jgi:hypothetical protein
VNVEWARPTLDDVHAVIFDAPSRTPAAEIATQAGLVGGNGVSGTRGVTRRIGREHNWGR